MSEDPAYVAYLKAKVDELVAQNKLLNDMVYYKEARIRTLNAEVLLLNNKLNT